MNLFSKLYGSVEGSKNKVGFLELWKGYIVRKARRDNSLYPSIKGYNFYSNGNATFSGKSRVSYYYTIDGYPSEISVNFRQEIRDRIGRGVRVAFVSMMEPHKIDWNSAQMKNKLKVWKSIDSSSDNVDAYNYMSNIAMLDNVSRRRASLVYLADAEQRRQRNFFVYRTMMIVSGDRGEVFDKSVKNILEYCNNTNLIVTRIEENLPDYLKTFSPFSMALDSEVLKNVGSTVLPDEQIARFSSYLQGKIGKGGISFGNDIYSGYGVYKTVKKRDTDAENIFITAETGGGKSYYLKALILQLIGDEMYRGTINDIEGFEYLPFGGLVSNFCSVVVLNMAEGQGCYFDPVEIHLTGNAKLDADMFNISKNFTTSILKVCLGKKLSTENEWATKIVDNAVARAYSKMGVDEFDMSTWGNSKGYDLYFVYEQFKDLYREVQKFMSEENKFNLELYDIYKVNEGYVDALDKVVARLSEYFESLSHGGIRANVFRNKVSLGEIVKAKLVINSFGMAGKSSDAVDPVQMALAQLSAANISYLRSIFSKADGVYNFKVWEEFQRWGSFEGSVATIKQAITGGRKLGDINFIVTNNVKELLDDDRFAIFDNITSFAVGAIESATVRKRVAEELSVPNLLPELDKLVLKKGSTESFEAQDTQQDQSIYEHAFLLRLDSSITTIVKTILPPEIASSSIFKTGLA